MELGLVSTYNSMRYRFVLQVNSYIMKERRTHKVTISLNDSEMRALQRYCDKYTVRNRSKLIRETLMQNILKRFDKDSPTLFDELF